MSLRQNHGGHGDNVGGDSITRSPDPAPVYTAVSKSPEDIMFDDYFFKAVELIPDSDGGLGAPYQVSTHNKGGECLVWISPGSIESVLAVRHNDESETFCIIGTKSGRRFQAELSDCILEVGHALHAAERAGIEISKFLNKNSREL